MTNPNDPAFSEVTGHGDEHYLANGLTKREWFAGMIISSMHARDTFDEGLANPVQRARIAIIDADALIAELDKRAKLEKRAK